MSVLADTSIWVDYLRRGANGPAGQLDGLLQRGSVMVCGPVLAELLAGTPLDRHDDLWLALGGLPWAELDHEGWRLAGRIASSLRRTGTSAPLTDVLIATACIRSGSSLWTRDADFERIRSVVPELRLHPSKRKGR